MSGPLPPGLRSAADAWIADDPDPGDRAELRALLADACAPGDAGEQARAELADRFSGRLRFGTAGLRGAVGAGPARMNRAVVRAATAALERWLADRSPGAPAAGVAVGCDARRGSTTFADEAAAVLTGAGIHVHLLARPCPTPLLAFAVRHLGAAAGIMITASHNPAADNGYKLYLSDGAQIVPPVDAQIEAAISRLGPLSLTPISPAGSSLATRYGDDLEEAYLDAVMSTTPGLAPPAVRTADRRSGPASPRVVYTPLHGVAGRLALRAIARAGFAAPSVVAAQFEPDPAFPTAPFPNPEAPGTLDLALAQARRENADLMLANDPDGDRLAVAAPDPAEAGGWRVLTGDQVGALIADHLLGLTAAEPAPERRLLATTVVSSRLLGKIAAAAGVRYRETLTGFKWIVRAADSPPGSRLLLGYEEALGYAVTPAVRDKDGISAALVLLSLAASARSAGQTLLDRWDALETRHGVHLTGQLSLPTRAAPAMMRRLRDAPPASLAGGPVRGVDDHAAPGQAAAAGLPAADVLIFRLDGARVALRPSGTEPILKAYLEVVEPPAPGALARSRADAAGRMEGLRAAVAALAGRG